MSNRNDLVKFTFSEVLQAIFTLCVYIPVLALKTALVHFIPGPTIYPPLRKHLSQALGPRMGSRLPLSIMQRMTQMFIQDEKQILDSKRYSHLKQQIIQPVEYPGFKGYWICRGMYPDPLDPRDTDVVFLYLHGGGYVIGHPLAAAPELLLVADILATHGYTASIFGLDYSLIPHAGFPKQLEQALAAYDWIIDELKVKPSTISLMGDSAGGHLAVSLLTALHQRTLQRDHPGYKSERKPAAAYLISPWLDLYNGNQELKQLRNKDLANNEALKKWADLLLRDTPQDVRMLYTNFATSTAGRGTWKEVLPPLTWISAGTDEPLFLYDIQDFVKQAIDDGANVVLEVKEGGEHVWQVMQAMEQHTQLLAASPDFDDAALMAGYRSLAQVIVSNVAVSNGLGAEDAGKTDLASATESTPPGRGHSLRHS